MHLIAKVTRIPLGKFHCNKLTSVQYIQDYASLIFLVHSVDSKKFFTWAQLAQTERR